MEDELLSIFMIHGMIIVTPASNAAETLDVCC